MVDPIAVSALAVSILTAAFVIIKQGIGLAIEYRESPETLRRREAIEGKLRDQYGQELAEFLSYCSSKKELDINDEEIRRRVIKLGTRTRYLNLGLMLLERMTFHSKRFLRSIVFSLPFMFVTIVAGAYLWETEPFLVISMVMPYGAAAVFFLGLAGSQLRKYYFARERFVGLSENASLDECQAITEEMRKRGMT